MDEYAYVNTSTGLNEETFTSAMSRGEYIYLLANYYSQDYQTYMDKHGFKNNIYLEDVVISTVSDAGDISFQMQSLILVREFHLICIKHLK